MTVIGSCFKLKLLLGSKLKPSLLLNLSLHIRPLTLLLKHSILLVLYIAPSMASTASTSTCLPGLHIGMSLFCFFSHLFSFWQFFYFQPIFLNILLEICVLLNGNKHVCSYM